MTINRPQTFANLRKNFGNLKQSQVDSFNLFFDEWDGLDKRHLAYILATVWHETAKTMLPIEEWGKGEGKRYGAKVWFDNKPYADIDTIFYGRGHTQNTWRDNYEKLTKANKKGWNFVKKPDLLLQSEPSVWATFYAMSNGLYTGKKLRHYFSPDRNDPVNARKIINGLDCANLIEVLYNKFYNSIV